MSRTIKTSRLHLRKFCRLLALLAFGIIGACERELPPGTGEHAVLETPQVRWVDDFKAAKKEALESRKPIFIAFNTTELGNPQSPDL